MLSPPDLHPYVHNTFFLNRIMATNKTEKWDWKFSVLFPYYSIFFWKIRDPKRKPYNLLSVIWDIGNIGKEEVNVYFAPNTVSIMFVVWYGAIFHIFVLPLLRLHLLENFSLALTHLERCLRWLNDWLLRPPLTPPLLPPPIWSKPSPLIVTRDDIFLFPFSCFEYVCTYPLTLLIQLKRT